MKTFCVQTLGCKVNQYESEQIAALLRARGLVEVSPDQAELRIINTCSVTVQAASQSRQSTRRMIRLPVLLDRPAMAPRDRIEFDRPAPAAGLGEHPSEKALAGISPGLSPSAAHRPRVVVTGCWATSDEREASTIQGVDAVLTHRHDVADELDRLLTLWRSADAETGAAPAGHNFRASESPPGSMNTNGWMMKAGTAAGKRTAENKAEIHGFVNENPLSQYGQTARNFSRSGTNSLPLLGEHQSGRQRAFLKVQDGCDAHCTYCIIPRLRPLLFSKPINDVVEEARRLVAAGHVEIVLTGIFLGAYGHETALRRRQGQTNRGLAELVQDLCSEVPGLKRVRLSSLEPGDLTDDLLDALRSHQQVVPHFHLPLQSGSDAILRRMNRQYTCGDFLKMIERVNQSFDRPALTTDIIVGFPGESDAEFERTLEVVRTARFIHVHAFPYSPRPGTAAARWTRDFVRGPIVNDRINLLRQRSDEHSLEFRAGFIGQLVEVIVERDSTPLGPQQSIRHGRCERYFPVHFESADAEPGDVVRIRIDRASTTGTWGTVVARRAEACV